MKSRPSPRRRRERPAAGPQPAGRAPGALALALTLAGAALAVVACGPRNFENENDRLRARVMDLEREANELRDRNAELESELAAAATMPGSLPASVRDCIPHLAAIEINRLSHLRDRDGDGRAESLALYVDASDGRSRPVQITGTLHIHAAMLPPDADAITVARVTFGPGEVRDAYRGLILGYYYAFDVPLALPALPAAANEPPGAAAADRGTVMVSVEFDDALTGRRLTATRAVPVR